jgi:membrane-bound inhibitor of C-type lysozyme
LERSDVDELYFIVPRVNIPSILRGGILSNVRAARVAHSSVAMEVVQQRRDNVRIPGAGRLHEYANLYICARNPMMFRLVMTNGSAQIAVLAVDASVLDLPNVVIADGNASSGYTLFAASPGGLRNVDHARVHGDWSGYAGERAKWEHKRVKCAEVLVPAAVGPEAITRILVPSDDAVHSLSGVAVGRPVVAAPRVFFEVVR